MLSEELRRRIEALNRQELPSQTHVSPATTAVASAISSLVAGVHRAIDFVGSYATPPRRFYDQPPDEHLTEHGGHGRYRFDLIEFWPDAATRLAEWQPNTRLIGPRRRRAELESFRNNFPADALFLDLETCGFAGSMVFLIGLVWCEDDRLVIDQLLARNYAEEKAALHTLQTIAARRRLLVTFNGKSFDWPMVQDRWIRHRLTMPAARAPADSTSRLPLMAEQSTSGSALQASQPDSHSLAHYDVLHHARRRWKRMLPNCKLQTLEQVVCRRSRREDISGSEIPLAYHQYVRTGDDRQIKLILHHNAMDLVTLVQIALRLAE